MKPVQRRLTFGELQNLDSIISLAQEQGVKLGDEVKVQSESVVVERQGPPVFLSCRNTTSES